MNSSESDFGTTIEDFLREGLVSARDITSRSKPDHQSTVGSSINTEGIKKWLLTIREDIQISMPVHSGRLSGGFYANQRHTIAGIISRSWNTDRILNALAFIGLHDTSNRLRDLCNLHKDDPDEPEVVLESLRSCAQFFVSYSSLKVPQIGLTPDGLLLVEWASEQRGAAVMVFRPSGLVQFAAMSKIQGDSRRVHDQSTVGEALDSIRKFVRL